MGKAVLHASDISGQCIDLPVALAWEERISKEMENLARATRLAGLEVPPNMQVETLSNPQQRAKVQLGFIDNILIPLWSEIARVFPSMRPLYQNLSTVVRTHYQILDSEGTEAANENAKRYENKGVFDDDYI